MIIEFYLKAFEHLIISSPYFQRGGKGYVFLKVMR
jgi:hypothetical protein